MNLLRKFKDVFVWHTPRRSNMICNWLGINVISEKEQAKQTSRNLGPRSRCRLNRRFRNYWMFTLLSISSTRQPTLWSLRRRMERTIVASTFVTWKKLVRKMNSLCIILKCWSTPVLVLNFFITDGFNGYDQIKMDHFDAKILLSRLLWIIFIMLSCRLD